MTTPTFMITFASNWALHCTLELTPSLHKLLKVCMGTCVNREKEASAGR